VTFFKKPAATLFGYSLRSEARGINGASWAGKMQKSAVRRQSVACQIEIEKGSMGR